MTFGDKLSKLRRDNNYTQEQLADILGVSRQAVSKWESNITYPETDKLIRMSKLFHCTTDYLLLEDNEPSGVAEQSKADQNQIFIESPLTKNLVSCFKVTSSPVIAPTGEQPKYLLLGVDRVSVFGEHTTHLGWYASEEDIQKEISEITSAIRNGEASYTIKHNIDIKPEILNIVMRKTYEKNNSVYSFRKVFRERKSEKTLWGMPLWHIGENAKGIVAVGLNARGIVAVGMKAKGVFSFGLISIGGLSFGLLTFGLLSIGLIALGIFSAGCLSVGILTAGAISLGIVSFGAIAIGDFSVGALAIGKYTAFGDHAKAMIALADTHATGTVFQKTGNLTADDIAAVTEFLDTSVPFYLSWAKELIKLLL